jgi:hypothetical protein
VTEIVYKDARGANQPLDLSIHTYKAAAEANQTLPEYLATQYPTDSEKYGSAFEQVLEQAGVFVYGDRSNGINATRMSDLLSPRQANAVTRDGTPVSRLLAPAIVLGALENRLRAGVEGASATAEAFDSMVAFDDTINGDRWERLVIDYSNAENAKPMPVAQLAMPPTMMLITTSDQSRRIPSWGIGVEISEQAQRAMTIDLLAMTLERQSVVERNQRAEDYVLALLNGDTDTGDVALSSLSGKVVTAVSLDATAASGVTQKAWVSWLSRNPTKRRIDTVITDLEGAMAIETRAGRPTASDNIGGVTQRFNTTFNVLNNQWPSEVNLYITNNPAWPAKTILGMDSRFGIHRVRSLTAQYEATEQFVLKRSTAMRFDDGEVVYRLYDEAFEVMTFA